MLESVFSLISGVGTINVVLIIILLIIGIFLAMKLFGFLLRALLTGLAFGIFPVIANYLGIPIPLTIDSVVSSALFGIIAYLAYSAIRSGFGILKIILWPFRKLFGLGGGGKKPQVIIKEVEKKDKKKE